MTNKPLFLDTEIIYKRIISSIAEKYGKKYTDEIKLKVLGTDEQTTTDLVVKLCGLPITNDEFHKEFAFLQQEQLGQCGFMPGTKNSFSKLKSIFLIIRC